MRPNPSPSRRLAPPGTVARWCWLLLSAALAGTAVGHDLFSAFIQHRVVAGEYEFLDLGCKLTASAGSDVPWGGTIGEARVYVIREGLRFWDYDGLEPLLAQQDDALLERVAQARSLLTDLRRVAQAESIHRALASP